MVSFLYNKFMSTNLSYRVWVRIILSSANTNVFERAKTKNNKIAFIICDFLYSSEIYLISLTLFIIINKIDI